MIAAVRGMERTLLLGVGVAIGVGVSTIVQRLIARRSARPLRLQSAAPPSGQLSAAVPPSQLCPSEFEEPSTDGRLLRRIETVVQRRTARIVLVLERLQDGHNYAAVLRTCESLAMWKPRRLRPRPAGSPEAPSSARSCLRLPRASASLGQSAAWASLVGHIGPVSHIGMRVCSCDARRKDGPATTTQTPGCFFAS